MTYSSDRLDRIEAILATVAESQARTEANLEGTRQLVESNAAGLRETRQITDSNARAIEAWGARIDEVQIETEEATSSTRADLATRINDGAQSLETAIADTVAMIADMGRQQQETDQRFEIFLAEARADRTEAREAREANTAEHRAFTQNIQVLLAEIARLWQRVAG
jgi:kynureninase